MKKVLKYFKFFLMTMIVVVLSACNISSSSSSSPVSSSSPISSSSPSSSSISSSSSSSSSVAKFDVTLPTEIPTYGEDSIQIHYQRKDNTYAPWSLWLWKEGGDGGQFHFNYMDDAFVIASYKLSDFNIDLSKESARLGFIVAKNPGTTWDAKDTDADRFMDFTDLEKDSAGIYHIYIFQADGNIYINENKGMSNKIKSANFNNTSLIHIDTTTKIVAYEIYENGTLIASKSGLSQVGVYHNFGTSLKFDFANVYTVKVTFEDQNEVKEATVGVQKLYGTQAFNDAYYYDGELGAIYTPTGTTFKVWSPVSTKIELMLYVSGTPKSVSASLGDDTPIEVKEMTKGEKGVFETQVSGDLEGKYYTYRVYNSNYPKGKEVVDPYAKSTGVNGLRGMVVDFAKTNPTGWENVSAHQYDRKELTVWETHVADVTSSSTWNGTEANRKKFLGLQEEGTTYTKDGVTVKTGFDHIKELGVNAVQLIPIFDQANDEVNPQFNWGYNPLNYNTLEGSYSSDPYDGYARIKEFKQVVQKYNEAGINIIMDVVYNHTNSVNGTNFDVLMPGYYYRYDGLGMPWNGSGCGNETASENLMMRKFMIDSTMFWAEEYKLGGFRFDLMGLHDIETMNLLTQACQTVNPAITIYGEPWCGGTSGLTSSKQAVQMNGGKFVGYGQFNDRMRDELIKGGLSAATDKSWISNTTNNTTIIGNLIGGIQGYTVNGAVRLDPDKTVNYVTCHDNYTLYDRFKAAGITDEATVKKMAMLANSVVFTSQGTTFMLAGEEFLRTKGGNHNSYNATYEVNELDYALKVEHLDMFQNYQKLIALKQDLDGLHLDATTANSLVIENRESNNLLLYRLTDTENGKEYIVIHSNGVKADTRSSIDLTGYTLYLDTLGELEGELGEVTPKAFQTIIAYK